MIRPAVPQDIFRLAEMGEAFFKEAGFAEKLTDSDKIIFDLESFGRTVGVLIDGAGIVLVAEKADEIIGMAAAGLAPAWWNNNVLSGQEIFFYCDPQHRRGAGRELMAGLEEAAKARGVVLFSMAAEKGLRSDALGRLYAARGYFPIEQLYWRAL